MIAQSPAYHDHPRRRLLLNFPDTTTLTFGSQPTYKLRPYQSRTFVIDELEGFRVEFQLGSHGETDELIFHQPYGTFVARRTQGAASP